MNGGRRLVEEESPVDTAAQRLGWRIEVRGTVQGVGFRPWVYRLAREEGVGGRVWNDGSGVEIEAFGPVDALDAFVYRLRTASPPAAAVREIRCLPIPGEAVCEFVIVPSETQAGERRVSIPPDLATCPECEAEIFDPRDRRYRYPFTNCTSCGPRFTIARGVPYDRAETTMACFEMCPRCRAEYERVEDRRFHAQPNACPVCGPRLWAAHPSGESLEGRDPVHVAALALEAGRIVAVKGIGGFHLACDATSTAAVERLRLRKRRDAKPFAVMVRDLEAAERIAVLREDERALLASVERPIVLLPRRPESELCAEIAPDNPLVGLMLPYSPLHHLLLAETERPLVMTSGNLAEEPIVRDNGEALEKLGGVADLFLLHDREIASRCDDSVARVIAGAPTVLRRSRGYVPRPVALARPFARPVLGCGAQLKNAVCLGVADVAYLGPHVGDLETMETYLSYQESIERLEKLVGIRPRVIAHDLHPEYLSTRYALERTLENPEIERIGVQHHHAHVASAMAEHGLAGPVLGLAFDGTGYGTDGTAWGGEILIAGFAGYERVATFRAMPLAGGDLAVREVWRLALAVLDDAFAGEPPVAALSAFAARGLDFRHADVVRRMIATGLNTPRARGVGRWFDAVGSLVLGKPISRYEGEVATRWNLAADPDERSRYPFALDRDSSPWEIDPRPMVRGVVDDLAAGRSPATISARFHNTLAAAAGEVTRAVREARGDLPVVLTGGCFQNALLAERIAGELSGGPPVFLHHEVPPGDGGLALGQAMVADALTSRRGLGK
jgi:hydrogenase maturation protein HypF